LLDHIVEHGAVESRFPWLRPGRRRGHRRCGDRSSHARGADRPWLSGRWPGRPGRRSGRRRWRSCGSRRGCRPRPRTGRCHGGCHTGHDDVLLTRWDGTSLPASAQGEKSLRGRPVTSHAQGQQSPRRTCF
jgi:hypothetical protein